MTKAVILMSALVPTIGHKALIDFALNVADQVYVVINSKSWEPVSGGMRMHTISQEFSNYSNFHIALLEEDDAIEADDGTLYFWQYWRDALDRVWGFHDFDYVVGSESYVKKMAEELNAKFMPFDMKRENTIVKGTAVRKDMPGFWDQILPSFRATIPTFKYVMFGAESTGKTTIGKLVTSQLEKSWQIPTKFIPEWARQYLETVGPELTAERMRDIVQGQGALEAMIEGPGHAAAVLDTDLYSTYGYYGILKAKADPIYSENDRWNCLYEIMQETIPARMYFLMPDDFPMTPDQIRYAGDKREGSYEYWKAILDVFGLPYHEVRSGSVKDKVVEIGSIINIDVRNYFKPIAEHKRKS